MKKLKKWFLNLSIQRKYLYCTLGITLVVLLAASFFQFMSASEIVTNEKTAVAVGSGGLSVYATPAMIALMEKSAYESVQSLLEEGSGTVGTLMNIQHISATPVDMKVTAESELIAIDGRKLTFKVTAFDEVGKIGEGTHERFIINNEKFQAKTNSKK